MYNFKTPVEEADSTRYKIRTMQRNLCSLRVQTTRHPQVCGAYADMRGHWRTVITLQRPVLNLEGYPMSSPGSLTGREPVGDSSRWNALLTVQKSIEGSLPCLSPLYEGHPTPPSSSRPPHPRRVNKTFVIFSCFRINTIFADQIDSHEKIKYSMWKKFEAQIGACTFHERPVLRVQSTGLSGKDIG